MKYSSEHRIYVEEPKIHSRRIMGLANGLNETFNIGIIYIFVVGLLEINFIAASALVPCINTHSRLAYGHKEKEQYSHIDPKKWHVRLYQMSAIINPTEYIVCLCMHKATIKYFLINLPIFFAVCACMCLLCVTKTHKSMLAFVFIYMFRYIYSVYVCVIVYDR